MRMSKIFAIAALATTLSAQAQIIDKGLVAVGNIGNMDNSQATLFGSHPGTEPSFIDSFVFDITLPGVAVGAISADLLNALAPGIASTDVSTISGIFLVDAALQTLAQDIDGSDGFSITSPLASAGNYAFLVAGSDGDGAGAYAGVLLSVNPVVTNPVPEPETYALMLGGLALLAGVVRRRRKAG